VFSVPADVAEAVGNLLTEVGSGVEQRDGETTPSLAPDTVEFWVWVSSTDVPRRVAAVETLLSSLREMDLKADPWSWRSEEVDPQTWQDAYKRYFTVHRMGRHFVVKPSWEQHEPDPLDFVIEMDPGMAFGTGLHQSTQLVVHAMERVARSGPAPQSVLDLGCGTGILAIAAAHLWPGTKVVALDSDESAVNVCRENVRRNHLEDRIRADHGSGAKADGRYDLVLANLSLETLTELRGMIPRYLHDSGHLILSGLLAEQANSIAHLYSRELLLEPEYSEEMDGWRALLFRVRD
jgi:ribosomal protein L11 methyltransferase